MECPSCKADVPDGSKFCNDCGAAVPIPLRRLWCPEPSRIEVLF